MQTETPLSAGPSAWRAIKDIFNNSHGFILSQIISQAGVVYRNSLTSSINTDAAIAAATIAPLNYAWLTIGSGAMRASNNFYKDQEGPNLGKRWRTCLIYGLSVGSLFIIPAYLISPYLMPLLHLGEASFNLAFRYNSISMISAPLRMIRTVDRHLFVTVGNQQNPLTLLSLFQALSACFISYFLKPILSVEGIALGQVTGSVLGLILTLSYLYKKQDFKKFELFQLGLAPWESSKNLVKEGFHNAISYLAETASNIAMMVMMSLISNEALIAGNIASQALQLFILTSFGLSVGLQRALKLDLINSYSMGWNYFNAALILALGIYFTSFGAYFLTPYISSCFLNTHDPQNQATLTLTQSVMKIAVFGGLGDHLRNIMVGGLQKFKDTKFIMWTTVACRGFIATSLSIYLGFYQKQGAQGVVGGHVIGVAIGSMINTARLAWQIHHSSLPEAQPLLPKPNDATTTTASPSSDLISSPAPAPNV